METLSGARRSGLNRPSIVGPCELYGSSAPFCQQSAPTARVAGDERKHKAAWSAAAHLGGKDLSVWMVMYPSGFQVHRTSHSNIEEWVAAGYDKKYIASYLNSQFSSYNHPNRAVEPRIPGIFQYYSVAEDELTKIFAGRYDAQTGANNVAAAWEKLTDQIGREKQIALYKASLGA